MEVRQEQVADARIQQEKEEKQNPGAQRGAHVDGRAPRTRWVVQRVDLNRRGGSHGRRRSNLRLRLPRRAYAAQAATQPDSSRQWRFLLSDHARSTNKSTRAPVRASNQA